MQDAGLGADAAAPLAYCRSDSDCASGHCADGVCCNEDCAGACRSCALPGSEGTCTLVTPGTVDPRGLCMSGPPEDCGGDGTCDAQGGCRNWARGTLCGPQICVAPNAAPMTLAPLARYACDGAGTCLESLVSCAPFSCASNACKLACRADADCGEGYACDCTGSACGNGGRCVGAVAHGQPCSRSDQCREGACSGGACDRDLISRLDFTKASGSSVPSPEGLLGVGTVRRGLSLDSPAAQVELVPGRAGRLALRLDGMDTFVTFSAPTALNKIAQSGQYTVAAWVKLEGPPAPYAWILSRSLAEYPDNHQFGLGHGPSDLPFVALSNASYTASAAPLPVNAWAHIASTYDGQTLVLYVNGQARRTIPVQFALTAQSTPLVVGGGRSAQHGDSFRGAIDEVVLLDRALSAAEVADWMTRR